MKQIKITKVFLKPEYFNNVLNCTVQGVWTAVFNNGFEVPICREWEASTAEDARAFYEMYLAEVA